MDRDKIAILNLSKLLINKFNIHLKFYHVLFTFIF